MRHNIWGNSDILVVKNNLVLVLVSYFTLILNLVILTVFKLHLVLVLVSCHVFNFRFN